MKKLQLKGLAFAESVMLSKEEKKQLMGGDDPMCAVIDCPPKTVCIMYECVPCEVVPPHFQHLCKDSTYLYY